MIKDENLLSRWSRRKLQSDEQTLQEDIHIELQQGAPGGAPGADLTSSIPHNAELAEPEPLLTDADMPDIESLHEDSDFSGFMSPGVSDELRNLALRKLFNAPSFNIRDGLDEYDEDYTSFEKLGDIITCDMKHQMEMEAKKKLREQQEALSTLEDSESDVDAETLGDEITQSPASADEDLPYKPEEAENLAEQPDSVSSALNPDLKTRELT